MPTTDRQRLRDHLDALAGVMADATDRDDQRTAYRLLRHVELAVELSSDDGQVPPAPVLARRFSRAHRRALRLDPEQTSRTYRELVPPPVARFVPRHLPAGDAGEDRRTGVLQRT